MKRSTWTQLAERAIHDTWSRLHRPPPMLADAAQVSADHVVLIEAGKAAVELADESEFHNLTLPPSVTRWGRTTWHLLRHAHVVGDQGHVFRSDGGFVNLCPSMRRLDPAKIRRPIPCLAQRVREPLFHLTGRDHENHGHFLMQHLPRLMAARPFLESQGIQPTILVPPGHENWQGRYLGTLGDLGARVIPCRKGTVHADELHYVPMLWDEGVLGPPQLYQQMQSSFRAFAGVSGIAPPKGLPVFVTREDAPTRRLSNEAEIIEICRRHLGEIEVLHLPRVPFPDQIRRFADAPLVIGPQGQGLTNIIFSHQTRMLILEAGESALEGGWACVYRDFTHMTGNSALRLLSGQPWPNDGDWAFPAAEFERQLQRVMALGLHLHRAPVLM